MIQYCISTVFCILPRLQDPFTTCVNAGTINTPPGFWRGWGSIWHHSNYHHGEGGHKRKTQTDMHSMTGNNTKNGEGHREKRMHQHSH